MANYNKTFNFKNGVQVDVDKFIVRGSLVGIGTSIPGETFDVVGNIRTAGLVTTTNLNVTGFATFNQVRVGAVQLSATSGVITATSFYGNGATLSNLPTSQWVDVDVGLGFTSIYAAGNVGVNTLDPRFSLQVGANPLDSLLGVGINSNGNIISTGIISATSFVGAGYGITALNASNFSSGAFPPTLLPVIPNDKLGPNLQLGIITATNQFYGNLTGIAQSASSLIGNINVIVGFITSVNLDVGIISAQNVNVHTNLNVGLNGSVLNANTNGRVGIGTTLGTADLQIRKSSNSLLEIISETSYARIAIGQSVQGVGAANSSSLIRYGYSPKRLDFINNDTGDINMYLHAGGTGINTGAFRWIYGQTNSEKMTLTYDGNLGLGITNPSNTLHVVGTSTVTGNSYVGGNLSVYNDFVAGGLTISNGTISNATISGSFSGTITGNINSTSGVSTFYQIQSTSSANLNTLVTNNIGIGSAPLTYPLQINSGSNIIVADQFGTLGLGTNLISASTNYNVTLDSSQGVGYFQGVGVGTTNPNCFADFSYAGNNVLGSIYQFMLPPKITTTQRTALTVVEGAFVYNTTVTRPQYYNGTRWFDITSTDGNSANAGFSTFARWAGISTIASVAGFATVSTQAGVSTIASVAGFATVSTQAGISTTVSGGIANVTTLQVTGISTFTNGPVRIGAGITMNNGNTGVITATGGFASGINTAPTQIWVSGNRLIFNVVGIGSTSFVLS
jgi:hypothetical protein